MDNAFDSSLSLHDGFLNSLSDPLQSTLRTVSEVAQEIKCGSVLLVGGAVRDLLLFKLGISAKLDIADIDLVVEGLPDLLIDGLVFRLGINSVKNIQRFSRYNTVSAVVDGHALDIAMSRSESYYTPGGYPEVFPDCILNDLKRRDFTVNAIAYDLSTSNLIDPFCGLNDISTKHLSFLHDKSVSDDPSRVIRAARYCARLDFSLSSSALSQVKRTIKMWPWQYFCIHSNLPVSLTTRLRMEFDYLFESDSWCRALDLLQQWGALSLVDQQLQEDNHMFTRLSWARKFGLPLLPALLVGCDNPLICAQRLQIPLSHQRLLKDFLRFSLWLQSEYPVSLVLPSQWTSAIESLCLQPQAVALMICTRPPLWRPLFRWFCRWRHHQSPVTARDLISRGWKPSVLLGDELRRLRFEDMDGLL